MYQHFTLKVFEPISLKLLDYSVSVRSAPGALVRDVGCTISMVEAESGSLSIDHSIAQSLELLDEVG